MKPLKNLLINNPLSSVIIHADAMAIDAFVSMESNNLDYVLIMDGSECIGIVSEIDYMRKIILTGKCPKQISVKEIMTRIICSVDITESIHRCIELLDTFKIRHLLVYDSEILKGVITLHELMIAMYEEDAENLMGVTYSKNSPTRK